MDILKTINLFKNKDYYIMKNIDALPCTIWSIKGIFFTTIDDTNEFINISNIRKKMEDYLLASPYQSIEIKGVYDETNIYVSAIMIDNIMMPLNKMEYYCSVFGITHAPIEEVGFDLPSKYDINALFKYAENYEEGIIVRPVIPQKSELTNNKYLSFEIINNKYLLKINIC